MTGFKQTFKSALVDVDSSAMDDLGCLQYTENAVYKYVKYAGVTAVAVNSVVCYTNTDNNLQTVDGANTAVGAGVAQAAVPVSATPLYGWVQVKGIATLANAIGGAPAFGSAVTTTGASAGAVAVAAALTNTVVGTVIAVGAQVIDCNFPA